MPLTSFLQCTLQETSILSCLSFGRSFVIWGGGGEWRKEGKVESCLLVRVIKKNTSILFCFITFLVTWNVQHCLCPNRPSSDLIYCTDRCVSGNLPLWIRKWVKYVYLRSHNSRVGSKLNQKTLSLEVKNFSWQPFWRPVKFHVLINGYSIEIFFYLPTYD